MVCNLQISNHFQKKSIEEVGNVINQLRRLAGMSGEKMKRTNVSEKKLGRLKNSNYHMHGCFRYQTLERKNISRQLLMARYSGDARYSVGEWTPTSSTSEALL